MFMDSLGTMVKIYVDETRSEIHHYLNKVFFKNRRLFLF